MIIAKQKMLKNRAGIWKKDSKVAIVGAPDDINKKIHGCW
jgi:hypothetical protein